MKRMKQKSLLIASVLAVSIMTACGEEAAVEPDSTGIVTETQTEMESVADESVQEKTSEEESGQPEDTTGQDEEAQADTTVPENTSGLPSLNSFQATTLDGSSFSNEDFAGRDVTIINIWGTYCGPCREEMPDLASFARSLPDNVALMTWCVDGAYEQESAKQILTEAGLEGVTLVGGDGDLEALGNEIMYIPTTILVDAKGNIIGDALIGGRDDLETEYTEAVNAALEALGKEKLN